MTVTGAVATIECLFMPVVAASIDIGPGLIGVLTILIATGAQLVVATLAYMTSKQANATARESKELAVEAKVVNAATHAIVNSQKTAMEAAIKARDDKIKALESSLERINETLHVERAMTTAQDPKPEKLL